MADVNVLRWLVLILAPLVLVSYGLGFARASSPEALWGGVRGRLRTAMTTGLAAAALGFLVYSWIVLVALDAAQRASLHLLGLQGNDALLLAYGVYLVPSALWFEATLWHLRRPTAGTKAATIGVLAAVSLGSLLLFVIGVLAAMDGLSAGPWLAVSGLLMAHQAVVMDSVFWVRHFPWRVAGGAQD